MEKQTVMGIPPTGSNLNLIFRWLGATKKTSEKDRPYLSVKAEVVKPAEVQGVDGKTYNIQGTKAFWTIMLDDEGQNGLSWVTGQDGLLMKLGFTEDEVLAFDPENPDTSKLDGVCFKAVVRSEDELAMTKDAEGKSVPVLDPETGEKTVIQRKWQGWPNQIIGKTEQDYPRDNNDAF